jgi:hypothetical protein
MSASERSAPRKNRCPYQGGSIGVSMSSKYRSHDQTIRGHDASWYRHAAQRAKHASTREALVADAERLERLPRSNGPFRS